jgi:hypothetical protein
MIQPLYWLRIAAEILHARQSDRRMQPSQHRPPGPHFGWRGLLSCLAAGRTVRSLNGRGCFDRRRFAQFGDDNFGGEHFV